MNASLIESQQQTAQKILKLKEEIASLERQFTPAEDPEEIVKTHIDLMHRYNDYKVSNTDSIARK